MNPSIHKLNGYYNTLCQRVVLDEENEKDMITTPMVFALQFGGQINKSHEITIRQESRTFGVEECSSFPN